MQLDTRHVAAGIGVLLLLGVTAWWWKRRARMSAIVDRARSYIGKVNDYELGADREDAMDCSAFAWRALGARKNHAGVWWNTDRIYDDAVKTRKLFKRVTSPAPGDVAVFPGRTDTAGKRHVGHVAIVVDPSTHTIIDCSSTLNGVHEHVDTIAHFWTRKDAIFARYIGP